MMNDLVETGRVDDMSFARWYVAEKNYFKPRGRIRLKAELSQKGISTDIIDKALAESEFTDKDLLHKLLSKYLMFESDLTDKEKLKLIQKLQRKGFSFSDSKSAIEEFLKKE